MPTAKAATATAPRGRIADTVCLLTGCIEGDKVHVTGRVSRPEGELVRLFIDHQIGGAQELPPYLAQVVGVDLLDGVNDHERIGRVDDPLPRLRVAVRVRHDQLVVRDAHAGARLQLDGQVALVGCVAIGVADRKKANANERPDRKASVWTRRLLKYGSRGIVIRTG